jgi:hypothetical protein
VNDQEFIAWAEARARLLYDGKSVAHRSCGIALAETFGRPTPAYQALRRGGITGEGQCGAIKSGELILGEIFGDPDPTGSVTPELRHAILIYQALWKDELKTGPSIICNDLTQPFGEFHSEARHNFCTDLATIVARCIARTLTEMGIQTPIIPTPER